MRQDNWRAVLDLYKVIYARILMIKKPHEAGQLESCAEPVQGNLSKKS
jgi:hypothetical protein